MPIRYPRSALTGDEGIDFISLTCSRAGALFLARPRQDVGIDGHIELLDGAGEPTGQLALIQSKAGLSYISEQGAYLLRASRAHFETWARYSLPVIGIVYNPATRDARWVDVSAHVREHPECVESGPFTIEAPAHQQFSEDQFGALRDHVYECGSARGMSSGDLLERYLSGDETVREEALTHLFAHDRWTLHCCFFVHAALYAETSQRVVRLLVYFQSFYRAQPDRFYRESNTMPATARASLERVAAQWVRRFDEAQILKMVEAIDPDSGLERGSLGQIVMLQVAAVDDARRKLERIVRAPGASSHARCYALVILIELGLVRRAMLIRLAHRESDRMLLEAVRYGLDSIRGR